MIINTKFGNLYIDEDCVDDGIGILEKLYMKFAEKSTHVEIGRNRTTFFLKKYVAKLPRNPDGYIDNDWEGSIVYAATINDPNEIQYPRTKLIYHFGVPIVFVEKVTPISTICNGFPDWVHSVDCGQVGFTSSGRLVAYDYGIR